MIADGKLPQMITATSHSERSEESHSIASLAGDSGSSPE